MTLMPVFVSKVLGGGPHSLGFLAGRGRLRSADRGLDPGLAPQQPRHRKDHGRGSLLFSMVLILLSLARTFWLAMPLDVLRRHGHDGADGIGQHLSAAPGQRRQAGPGDEHLYHGLHGRHAHRQFPVRCAGQRRRRHADDRLRRRPGPDRAPGVRLQIPAVTRET